MTAVLPQSNKEEPEEGPRHAVLRSHPVFWSFIGIVQTLLTAGVVFGWASLLPIIRDEKRTCTTCKAEEFSIIFTAGAIGNYVSTLFFGTVLDMYGPRLTAIVASVLFSAGLVMCSIGESGSMHLLIGVGLLGFSGPGVQMPTLHFANLFPDAALYMSSQAAAFDGGTFVFALARSLFYSLGVSTATFFQWYMIVPIVVFITAIIFWPASILQSYPALQTKDTIVSPYIGTASSPALSMRSIRNSVRNSYKSLRSLEEAHSNTLVDAPLKTVLSHPTFWMLASWTSINILKLNFVVATINDQLKGDFDKEEVDYMINMFGLMLPFGFVILPVVAHLLSKSPMGAVQLANTIGVTYGAILLYFPNKWLLTFVVFPAVATSRQMVYSTVFHQIGEIFGFANYGTLLGLTNVLVSAFSMIQTPLVGLSEDKGNYKLANSVLLLLTFPLFFVKLDAKMKKVGVPKKNGGATANEETPLVRSSSHPR